MSQGKSGFEIRADLLNQAQGLLEGNIYRTNEAIGIHNDNFPNDKKPVSYTHLTLPTNREV